MDTQTVEILGRNLLVAELLSAGIEVALPLRDRGVDLIAYLERGEGLECFSAFPVQMKAASTRAFSIDRKYAPFRNLILAYVWNVGGEESPEIYALTYEEAVNIGDKLGWTGTASWEAGAYATTKPSARLLELLGDYRMKPQGNHQGWRGKLVALAGHLNGK